MVDMYYDTHYKENLPPLKTTIPLIKQWIEAKENWCENNKENCKIMKENKGFCFECLRKASELGVVWPEDFTHLYRTSFTTWVRTPCKDELLCSTADVTCSALNSTVDCRLWKTRIMTGLKGVSNYPLGNQLSCVTPVNSKQGNAFCKQISQKEPISFEYNPDLEDDLARLGGKNCIGKENTLFCKIANYRIISKHPLNEFNFYPLD